MEGVLRFARDGLGLRPPLTAAQFLSPGFAERKLQLAGDIARRCKEVHNAAARQERLAVLKSCHAEQRLCGGGGGSGQQEEASPCGPPLPHVRVVGGVRLLPAPEPSSDDRHGADAGSTPISVVAVQAGQHPGAGGLQGGSSTQLPELSAPPAEQPRPLPPSLLLARSGQEHSMQQQPGGEGGTSLPVGQPAAAQPAPPPQQPQLCPPAPQLQHSGAQPPPGLQLAGIEPAAHLASQQQQGHQQDHQQLGCSSGGALANQQARRLIEGLQLRLGLAEDAVAAVRCVRRGSWQAGLGR